MKNFLTATVDVQLQNILTIEYGDKVSEGSTLILKIPEILYNSVG